MRRATPFHSQTVSSYWNNWQFIAGRRKKNQLITWNWGILRSKYCPGQFVFTIHGSFIMLLHRKVNELLFFSFFSVIITTIIIILNWNAILKWSKRWLFSIWQYYGNSLCNVTTCCVIVKGWISPSGERLNLYLPYSLWPASYMYDNVINSHCYRFIMYFSNLILYVY